MKSLFATLSKSTEMEPPRSINVWVSVKFHDADGNELQLDAEEVTVTTGDNLVQLVQATAEQLK